MPHSTIVSAPPSPKLLLVDHRPGDREMLSRTLAHRGYQIEVAESGPEALEKIDRAHFDLVLLDQMMPGVSGLDLLRLLRVTYSQSVLPVIMVTPSGSAQCAVDALCHGANDHVSEPFDLPVVAARIQAQVDRSRADRIAQASDPLTGLYNRSYFLARLSEALSRPAHPQAAVLLIGLHGCKMLNESIGGAAVDRALIEAARRFHATLDGEGVLARIGDTEFAVLLESCAGASAAEAMVRELLCGLEPAFDLTEARRVGPAAAGLQVSMTASAGIAVQTNGLADAGEILRDAALAMTRAHEQSKEAKNTWQIFDPVMRRGAQVRMALALDLQHALEQKELTLFYQPKVHLATRTIIGFEALLRWHHPKFGLIPPTDFIPVAEETGLILPIGAWVLREACEQLKRWQAKFPCDPALSMNVNLSVKQLADPNLIPGIRKILAETGIPPHSLKLELTESILVSEMESSRNVLSQIQGLRIGLKLDDFGTGYSSLSYLRSLPFDSLKIDRSFINRLETDWESGAIIAAILNLARSLHMNVVAEGIETEGQAAQLLALGCDIGQGYLFSKPVAAEFAERLMFAAVAA